MNTSDGFIHGYSAVLAVDDVAQHVTPSAPEVNVLVLLVNEMARARTPSRQYPGAQAIHRAEHSGWDWHPLIRNEVQRARSGIPGRAR